MSETITYTTLTSLLKDTVSAATAEACLMQAIRAINLEGLGYSISLTQLTGSSGSMSGTYTGAEVAAILQVATAVYSQNYKNSGASSSSSESLGVGPFSQSQSSSSSASVSSSASSVVSAVAKDMAWALFQASREMPIYIGCDTS